MNYSYRSVAKLNLALNINGKMPNGYHELQTVFQYIDLYDVLSFDFNDSGKINIMSNVLDICNDDNLVVKAIKLIERHCGLSSVGVDVNIEKNIPICSGLGGGSSNAAVTMMLMNKVFNLSLTSQELIELGQQIGADVPFFLFGHNAVANGIGEKLRAVTLPNKWFLVVFPRVYINTKLLFTHVDLSRNSAKMENIEENVSLWKNDFHHLALHLYPKLAKVCDCFSKYGRIQLTGSGSALFMSFDTKAEAEKVIFSVQCDDIDIFLVPSLSVFNIE